MIIKDIKVSHLPPFEIDDSKLKELFSFFLHLAPNIESKSSIQVDDSVILNGWMKFIDEFTSDKFKFVAESCSPATFSKKIDKYGLNDNEEVHRKSKVFVCKRKNKYESDCNCILRHMRNSIAHSCVYISMSGNRKYILFEDFNKKDNITAKILLSQTDLKKLKQYVKR